MQVSLSQRLASARHLWTQPTQLWAAMSEAVTDRIAVGRASLAERGVRFSSALMDLAAVLLPALPLSIAAALLGTAGVVYAVLPVTTAAVWLWMQIWQGFSGASFGKAVLGLRLVRDTDDGPAGPGRVFLRSALFVATAGLAALPVMLSSAPRSGLHDRLSGVKIVDLMS